MEKKMLPTLEEWEARHAEFEIPAQQEAIREAWLAADALGKAHDAFYIESFTDMKGYDGKWRTLPKPQAVLREGKDTVFISAEGDCLVLEPVVDGKGGKKAFRVALLAGEGTAEAAAEIVKALFWRGGK